MTKRLYVVRHARAGDREHWTESDRLRPPTPLGECQARALARWLRAAGVRRLLSSLFVHCVDTPRPLGELACVPVERDNALAEGGSCVEVWRLLRSAPSGTALCTHGNVILELLDAAVQDGVPLGGRLRLAKASIWIFDIGRAGVIEYARYRPPPIL